eukprot:s4389_g9.t1
MGAALAPLQVQDAQVLPRPLPFGDWLAFEALLAFGLTFGAFASIFAFGIWAISTSILAFAFDVINIHGLRPEMQADADQRVWLASHLSIKRSEVRVLDQRVAVHKSKLLNQLTFLCDVVCCDLANFPVELSEFCRRLSLLCKFVFICLR